jgi:3-oxoadipate enol-lactonase
MPWLRTPAASLRYDLTRGSGGPGILLLHELGGGLESWDGVVPHLPSACPVLRPDLRGAGGSQKPRHRFSIAEQAEDVVHLARALDLSGPWHVAGVAAGAAVALTLAAAYPGQMGSLALCCPATNVDPDRVAYLTARAEKASREGMAAVAEASLAISWPGTVAAPLAAREAYLARFLGNDPVAYGLANRALAEACLDDAIAVVDVPCLVLAGVHDRLRPPQQVAALAARIRGAVFEQIDAGHLMPVQAPVALGVRLRRFFSMETVPA